MPRGYTPSAVRQTSHLTPSIRRQPGSIAPVLFGLAAAAMMAAAGCSDRGKTVPIGLGSLEPGRFEELVQTYFASPPDSDRYAESVTSAGDSPTLYVGYYGPRQMRSLIRFSPLPSGLVRQARVVMTVTGSAGPAVPLSIEAHRVRIDWNETIVNDTLPPEFDVDPIATVVSAPGETLLAFDVPESLLSTWGADAANNTGLLLTPVGTDSTLRKFGSSEALTKRPFLRLVLDTGGGAETVDTVFADRDAYLAKADTTRDRAVEPILQVGRENGFTYRSTLIFRIPEVIDERSTINYANLELFVDKPRSGVGDTSFAIGAHAPVPGAPDSLALFLTTPEGLANVSATSDTVALLLTDFVARLRLARSDSVRVLVRSAVELADTRFVAFVSEEGAAADPSRAPRLRFIVSSPAQAETMFAEPIAASAPSAERPRRNTP